MYTVQRASNTLKLNLDTPGEIRTIKGGPTIKVPRLILRFWRTSSGRTWAEIFARVDTGNKIKFARISRDVPDWRSQNVVHAGNYLNGIMREVRRGYPIDTAMRIVEDRTREVETQTREVETIV